MHLLQSKKITDIKDEAKEFSWKKNIFFEAFKDGENY
jgi:hypothetical protein